MVEEIWRPVVGFESLYEVSNFGRVRSLNYRQTGQVRVLKAGKNRKYLFVILYKNGLHKHFSVHRLVAMAFIPNPDNLPEVNHINESPWDNRVENLEYCSHLYNSQYGTRGKRISKKNTNRYDCSKPVAQYTIDGKLVAIYPSVKEGARKTDILSTSIYNQLRGLSKIAGGFLWKYI